MSHKLSQTRGSTATPADSDEVSVRAGVALQAAIARSGRDELTGESVALRTTIQKAVLGARARRSGGSSFEIGTLDNARNVGDTFRQEVTSSRTRQTDLSVGASVGWPSPAPNTENLGMPVDFPWTMDTMGTHEIPCGIMHDVDIENSWPHDHVAVDGNGWYLGDLPSHEFHVQHPTTLDFSTSCDWANGVATADAVTTSLAQLTPEADVAWQDGFNPEASSTLLVDSMQSSADESCVLTSTIWAPPDDLCRKGLNRSLGVAASTASTTDDDTDSDDELLASCFAGPDGIPDF